MSQNKAMQLQPLQNAFTVNILFNLSNQVVLFKALFKSPILTMRKIKTEELSDLPRSLAGKW